LRVLVAEPLEALVVARFKFDAFKRFDAPFIPGADDPGLVHVAKVNQLVQTKESSGVAWIRHAIIPCELVTEKTVVVHVECVCPSRLERKTEGIQLRLRSVGVPK